MIDKRFRITGLVTRLLESGGRVSVPRGVYAVHQSGFTFKLSRPGGPAFDLDVFEWAHYTKHAIKPVR
jgi:hypothetical protein